ncbi:28037_t:CDS:2, partial [Racocetra persica]
LTLISTSDDFKITLNYFSHTLLLLLFSASVIPDSYFSSNKLGLESFMLAKKLYNSVNSHKNVESEVIVSYTNQNGHYDMLKNNLKRTVLSNYAGNEQSSDTPTKGKEKAQNNINNHLETIEEKYTKLNFSPSQKRKTTLLTTFFLLQKYKNLSLNLNPIF